MGTRLGTPGDLDENKLGLQRWTDKRFEGSGYHSPSQVSDACYQKHPDTCQRFSNCNCGLWKSMEAPGWKGRAVGAEVGSLWLVRAERRRVSGER